MAATPPEVLKLDAGVSLSEWVLKYMRKYAKTDRVAQVCGHTGESMSFNELLRESVRFAKGIQSMGVKIGETVSILARNYHQVFVATLGCLYSGVTVAPSVPNSSPAEFAYHLTLVVPRYVLIEEELTDVAHEAIDIAENSLPQRPHIVCLQSQEFTDILDRGNGSDPFTFEPVPIRDRGDHVVFILYSSGTTGLSKGVMLSDFGLTLQMDRMRDSLLNLRDVLLASSPMSWVTALLMLFQGTKHGTNRIFVRESDPAFLLDCIEKYKIQSWVAAPAVLLGMTDLIEAEPTRWDISCLTHVIAGGSSMSAETQNRISRTIGAAVQQAYGCTETGLITSGDFPGVKAGSAGRVVCFAELTIVDPETEEIITEPRKVGEFRVKPTLMKGYVGNPEATASAFDSEGRYKSGDLGFLDEDGDVYVVDRIKEMIKYRGYQIAPAEVEGLLLQDPRIADVCVIGKPHPIDIDLPTAFVVRSPKTDITEDEVKAIVASTLSDAKKLRGGVIFLDSLPRTATGKTMRKKLKEMLLEMSNEE